MYNGRDMRCVKKYKPKSTILERMALLKSSRG